MMLNAVIGLMGGYDPDAVLYFNQLTVQPSTAYKNAINTLVLRLKSDNNWNKLDRLWIHAAEIQQHARVSLVNPSSTQITEVGTPAWSENSGYTMNGSSRYLNTNYNATTNGATFTKDVASVGVYADLTSDTALNCLSIGGNDGSFRIEFVGRSSTGVRMAINQQTFTIAGANTTAAAFFHARRTVTETRSYVNGAAYGVAQVAGANPVPSVTLYIGARSAAGTATSFSAGRYMISFIGGAVNDATFYSAIQAFATTIGFNV